jgi:sporulation protein YlmC with PRC-barrel domain
MIRKFLAGFFGSKINLRSYPHFREPVEALLWLYRFMTKAFLTVAVICTVSVMLSGVQRVKAEPPSPDSSSSQSTSSKHLSATGRTSEPCVPASKLVGSQVDDRAGNHVGELQDIIVNPRTGRIDFAMVSLSGTPTNAMPPSPATSSANPVPVPWSLLKAASAAQYGTDSERPVFTVNADRNRLAKAPTVDWSDPDQNQSQWRQRIYSYYGVTPPPSAPPPLTRP